MRKFSFLLMSLFMMLTSVYVYGQVLEDDYDRRERAVDPFEDEDKLLREKKINEIISRIRAGDKTVLRLVVYDTFEAVHDELVRQDVQGGQKTYYDIVGNASALPAYIGGFDNQDPKVRLKCIGYLGDWADEVGKGLKLIERHVDKRLASNVETRKEVRYGYRVLKMKIVRRRVIERLARGDKEVLVRISPEEFLPLVFYEPRIRTIYLGSAGAVKIRSIVLDPGIEPETGELITERPGRAEGLDIERVCYRGVKEIGDRGEVAQWLDDVRKRGGVAVDQAALSGGYVGGGDYGSSKDSGGSISGKASLNWKCVQAIFTGVDNKSLFVREHAARIFLNYVRGYTGNPNYAGNVGGTARTFAREFGAMSKNPYYVRLAQVAWDNVKWSDYYYNDRFASGSNYLALVQNKHYLDYQYNAKNSKKGLANDYAPANTKRYFTDGVTSYPEWGTEVTGNYRNDIKEILRLLGLSWYIDAEYVVEGGGGGDAKGATSRSRVDTLFNDRGRSDRPKSPDRSDRLEGEVDGK